MPAGPCGGFTGRLTDVTSGVFQAEIPKVLFKVPQGVLFWDVFADGKRLLRPAPSAACAAPRAELHRHPELAGEAQKVTLESTRA